MSSQLSDVMPMSPLMSVAIMAIIELLVSCLISRALGQDAIISFRYFWAEANIKVTGNAEPKNDDLPETFVAFSRAATG